MQKVIISGNIGNDATLTQGQRPQYRFTVGVFNGKDEQGNSETAWYTVFCPTFAWVEGRLTKGTKVSVIGTLKPGLYVSNDGQSKLDLTVNADSIEIFDGAAAPSNGGGYPPQGYPQAGYQQGYRQGMNPVVAAGAAVAAQNAYRQNTAPRGVMPRPAAPQPAPFEDDLPL